MNVTHKRFSSYLEPEMFLGQPNKQNQGTEQLAVISL